MDTGKLNIWELAKSEGIDLKKYEALRRVLTPEQRKEKRIKAMDIKIYFYTVTLVVCMTIIFSYSLKLSIYAFAAVALINLPILYSQLRRERNLRKLSDLGYFVHILLATLLLLQTCGVKSFSQDYLVSIYVLATGPVLLKLLKRSYMPIFHSFPRFFEFYYHFTPALLLYLLRWYDDEVNILPRTKFEPSMLTSSMIVAGIAFIVWGLIYFVLTNTICAKRRSRSASSEDAPQRKSVLSNPLFENLICFGISSIPAVISYHNFYLSTSWIFIVGVVSVYRAGGYYVYDFPTSYQRKLKELAASTKTK